MGTQLCFVSFENGGMGHESWNAGKIKQPEEARDLILHWRVQKHCGPADIVALAQ